MSISKFYEHYVFLKEINTLVKNKLLKFTNINIIIDLDKQERKNINNLFSIINFAKKKRIPFFLKNSFKECIKFKANGVFLESQNKKMIKPVYNNRLLIIGAAHNQIEYEKKLSQGCTLIMLSPLFYNEKYTVNKFLNINKFNIISMNWKTKVCALGGINEKNLKKIKLTKVKAIAFKRFLYEK